MKTPYIRKTCMILITMVLIVSAVFACKTIVDVNAVFEPSTKIDINGHYIDSDEPDKISTIDETIDEITTNVVLVETELIKIQESSIVEEFDDDVWTTSALHLRDYPSTDGNIETTLSKNTKIHRLGRCANGWYAVRVGERTGYVHYDYITTEEPVVVQLESGDKNEYQAYALSLLPEYGWSDSEMEPLIILWNRESGWNPLAENPSSGAYGIPQSLPGDKMASVADDWRTNYKTQIRWGLNYISQRYGSPTKALEHSYETGWY